MLQSCDFTSLYIPSISPSAAAQLYGQGYRLAQIGMDSSPASANVYGALLGANFLVDCYRFIYWDLDVSQVQSAIDGIHAFSPDVAHLPGYLFVDLEEVTNPDGSIKIAAPANPADYLHRLRLYIENAGITPTSLVKPGVYTRRGWYEEYCPGLDELSSNNWVLWSAEEAADPDHATPYGGWSGAAIVGVQNRWELASPIGTVDGSVFRDRGAQPQPPELLLQPVGTFYASDGKTPVVLRAG